MLATASSFTDGVGPGSAQCSLFSGVGMATAQPGFGTILLLQLDKILDDAELQLTRVFRDHKSQFQEVIGKLQQQCITLSTENERLIQLLETKPFSSLPMDFMGKEATMTDQQNSANKLSPQKSPTILRLIQKFDQGLKSEGIVGDASSAIKRDINSTIFVPTPPVTSRVENATKSDASSDNDYVRSSNYNWLSPREPDKVSPLSIDDGGYGTACAHGDARSAMWTKVETVPEEESSMEDWEESSGWTTSSGDSEKAFQCRGVRKRSPTARHIDARLLKALVDTAQQVVDRSTDHGHHGPSRSKTFSDVDRQHSASFNEPGHPRSHGSYAAQPAADKNFKNDRCNPGASQDSSSKHGQLHNQGMDTAQQVMDNKNDVQSCFRTFGRSGSGISSLAESVISV